MTDMSSLTLLLHSSGFIMKPIRQIAGCFLSCILVHSFAQGQVSVAGELSQDRFVNPGDVYEGSITLLNTTEEPQEAMIYQTDYLFQADGTNRYGDPGTIPRSNASWITFSPSDVVIPSQGSTEVHFRVQIPADTIGVLQGTYWSMLMIETIPKGGPESSFPPISENGKMGIRQSIRYGIQIASHLVNTGTKEVRFLNAELVSSQEGNHLLKLDIENTGTTGMRPEVYVELFDENGSLEGRFEGLKYRIYPGTSVRQMIDLGRMFHGEYTALIVIDDGGNDVFGAQYTLEF